MRANSLSKEAATLERDMRWLSASHPREIARAASDGQHLYAPQGRHLCPWIRLPVARRSPAAKVADSPCAYSDSAAPTTKRNRSERLPRKGHIRRTLPSLRTLTLEIRRLPAAPVDERQALRARRQGSHGSQAGAEDEAEHSVGGIRRGGGRWSADVIAAVRIVPPALHLRSRNRNEFSVLATLGKDVAAHNPHFGRIAIPFVATAPVGTIRHVPSAVEFLMNGDVLRGMLVLRRRRRRKRQGSAHPCRSCGF
jgi:hypothetical protein